MTGRENIYMNGAIMGMSRTEITRKLDEIVDFSGCERYLDTPMKRYSSGMTVRLGFVWRPVPQDVPQDGTQDLFERTPKASISPL